MGPTTHLSPLPAPSPALRLPVPVEKLLHNTSTNFVLWAFSVSPGSGSQSFLNSCPLFLSFYLSPLSPSSPLKSRGPFLLPKADPTWALTLRPTVPITCECVCVHVNAVSPSFQATPLDLQTRSLPDPAITATDVTGPQTRHHHWCVVQCKEPWLRRQDSSQDTYGPCVPKDSISSSVTWVQ